MRLYKAGVETIIFPIVLLLILFQDGRMPRYIAQRGRDICQHIVGMKPLTIGHYPPSE